jgi:hypothetical protein
MTMTVQESMTIQELINALSALNRPDDVPTISYDQGYATTAPQSVYVVQDGDYPNDDLVQSTLYDVGDIVIEG